MAITYKYLDALNAAGKVIPRIVEDDQAAFLCNEATNEVWSRYDWRESVVQLPPFYLVPNEQDHGPPSVAVPADFLGLRMAYLVRLTSSPPTRSELLVMRDVRLTQVRALAHAIGYEPARKSFRLYHRVPSNIGASDYMVDGEYKKRPTKITSTIIASTDLPFDDLYFGVMVEALKWAAWKAAGDGRAGQIQVQGGRALLAGQRAVLQERIDWMAANEGLELGDPQIAPSEPIGGNVSRMRGGYLAIPL